MLKTLVHNQRTGTEKLKFSLVEFNWMKRARLEKLE